MYLIPLRASKNINYKVANWRVVPVQNIYLLIYRGELFPKYTIINKKSFCVKTFDICIYLEIIDIAHKGGHFYALIPASS